MRVSVKQLLKECGLSGLVINVLHVTRWMRIMVVVVVDEEARVVLPWHASAPRVGVLRHQQPPSGAPLLDVVPILLRIVVVRLSHLLATDCNWHVVVVVTSDTPLKTMASKYPNGGGHLLSSWIGLERSSALLKY